MKTRLCILTILIILAVFQCAYYYGKLPATMASHFNAAGEPDGWMSRESFIMIYLITFLFLSVGLSIMPALLNCTPTSWISLPKRDYWLSPERKEMTINTIKQKMGWFSSITMLFFLFLFEMAFRVNLTNEPRLPTEQTWILLIVYLLAIVIWLVSFMVYFCRIPSDDASNVC